MQLGVNIPNVIFATLMLILVVVAIAAVFIGFFWLVYRLGAVLYRWLSRRKFYIELRQRQREWWERHRTAAIWWWESMAEVFIDPAFYGYVLVTLYQRVQAISDYAKTYPQYSFWQLLDLDTRIHMQYYIVLVVIFLLWMTWRVHKHGQEVRFENAMNVRLDKLLDGNKVLGESIKENSESIKQLTKNIEKLVEEIRSDREGRHEE
jgi:hypothetical protein